METRSPSLSSFVGCAELPSSLFSGGGSLLGLIVAFVVFSRVMPPVFHAAIRLLYQGI